MPFAKLLIRLVVCCAVAYVAWRILGTQGLIYSSIVFGVALARPIIDSVASAYGAIRSRAYRDVEGRHYSYQGKSVDMVEDDRGYKWLLLADVRKILPSLPRDESLRTLLGVGVATLGSSALRVRAEALHEYLAKASTSDPAKFRRWLERTVIFPSGRARASRNERVRESG
jgi:hypothetical protein